MVAISMSKANLIATIATGLATVILVVVGYLTLVASTRAWVGPAKATVAISDAGIVTIKVTYRNSGREPAIRFGDDWADDWAASIDADSSEVDFSNKCHSDGNHERCGKRAFLWKRDECDGKQFFENRVAFPDFSYTHSKTGLHVDKGDFNRVVVVQGCFVYESDITLFTSIHRTAFCYFYRIGQPGDEMRACPVGNSAT